MGMKKHIEKIGQTGTITFELHFGVPVTVKDVKNAYGNIRYLVAPIGGTGEGWVDASRIEF